MKDPRVNFPQELGTPSHEDVAKKDPKATPYGSSSVRARSGSFWQRSQHLIWLTGGALVLCLFMIFAVIGIIVMNGAPYFWPKDVVAYKMADGTEYLAIPRSEERIPPALAKEQGLADDPHRSLIMVGNREFYGQQDFIWINHKAIASREKPVDAWVMERHEYGNFIGYVNSLTVEGNPVDKPEIEKALPVAIAKAQEIVDELHDLEKYEIGKVNARIESLRLERIRAERNLKGRELDVELNRVEAQRQAAQKKYEALLVQVGQLRELNSQYRVELGTIDGKTKEMSLFGIIEAWKPNALSIPEKIAFYIRHFFKFLLDDPRESNTEGGIFPAIVGTAAMVILMSVAVVPFGVLTAFYLSEYAKQGPVVRAVRIALNNLAGVPSIVYGVFGLGFFIYFLGGWVDRTFYPEALPNPTWGTGGLIWASLTLALLTLPVVVMATEESIAAVPRGMREGSLALGASKFQTLKNILLPASMPGILTGVILAMARGAGEVAPLMITGVVKLAPALPLDAAWPFLHLDRKFMHLGFHIYDVGFQSPNVEASRPMVFTTALLLLLLVIALNLAAILIRERVRRKYTTGAFN
jgi:phosphate transport system permease protein